MVDRTFTIREAKQALQIDKNDLDEELIRQPVILSDVGAARVKAENIRDRAKDALEREEAEAYLKGKEDAEKGSTDHSIRQRAKIRKKVVAAQAEYREAKREAAEWDVLWTSFMQRSFMLNKLAELYTAQFYSKDSTYERPSYDRKKDRTKHRRKKRIIRKAK